MAAKRVTPLSKVSETIWCVPSVAARMSPPALDTEYAFAVPWSVATKWTRDPSGVQTGGIVCAWPRMSLMTTDPTVRSQSPRRSMPLPPDAGNDHIRTFRPADPVASAMP